MTGDRRRGENRAESDGGNGRPDTRAAADARHPPGPPWNLSGPEEPNGLRSYNNDSIPEGASGRIAGGQRRRGQRPSGSAAAQRASRSDSHLNPPEATGARRRAGGKRNSWGTPPREILEKRAAQQIADAAAAAATADALRNTNQHRAGKRGDRGSAHFVREGAENEEGTGADQSIASGRSNGDDRFARERPGDRYYLPPPRRNSRPRTSPDDSGSAHSSTPRPSEKRRGEQGPRELGEGERAQREQRQQRKRSRAMSARSSRGDVAESSSSVQSRRHDPRRSSSSDRLYAQQAADHRPMLGASEASGPSNMPDWRYGWRGPFTAAPSAAQSQEEESLPYYVDRKQVRARAGRPKEFQCDDPTSVIEAHVGVTSFCGAAVRYPLSDRQFYTL